MAIPISVSGTVNAPQGRHWFSIVSRSLNGTIEFETPATEKDVTDPAAAFSGGAPTVS